MNIFSFIKSRITILDVVGEYATLKKAGLYWKGHCPFHHERTASFTVSPHKEIYYCFGCQSGGDLIAFISKVEHCSQLEAARHIVERYSLELPQTISWERSDTYAEDKRRYMQMCSLVAQWCHEMLLKNGDARRYLEARSMSTNSIEQFSLGYFPGGVVSIKSLLEFAKKNNILAQELIAAKIILEGKSTLYSPFEERIIFPIKDHLGRVSGFGGRVFKPDDDRAKYYNSHDHEFFNKSTLLFGLAQAKKSIQTTETVFLVEGYTDCIAMAQAGYTNTVATLGTACTLDHLKQLARYAQQVYVVYDGDTAGQNAIIRLTQMCWHVNMDLSVITLPDKDDPASYLSKKQNFEALIEHAQDIFIFFIERLGTGFGNKRLQERLQVAQKILVTIATIIDPLKRDLVLQKAASTFDIPFDTLQKELQKIDKQTPSNPEVQDYSEKLPENCQQEITILEKKLFSAILTSRATLKLEDEDEEFLIESLPTPLALVMQKLHDYKKLSEFFEFTHFFDLLEQEEKELVSKIVMEQEDSQQPFPELFAQFQKKQWKIIVNDVKIKLAQAQKTDGEHTKKILTDFQALKNKMLRRGLI